MQLISHRIINPTGQSTSFNDYLLKIWNKTAESKKQDEDTSDNNVNNDNEEGAHSYQEGESVDGKADQAEGKADKKEASAKKVTAKCGKEMGKSDDAGKITEKHTPASSTESGSEDKGGTTTEQFINNDPNYQKGESVTMKKKDEKKSQASNMKSSFQKISSMNRKQKLELFAQLGTQKHNPIEYIQAMVGIKVANLTSEEKEWLRKFWSTQWPEAYVSEMLADR